MALASWKVGPVLLFSALALGSITVLSRADAALGPRAPLEPVRRLLSARPAPSAHGKSRGVRMRTVLPGDRLDLPLELTSSPEGVSYEWVPVGSLAGEAVPRPLLGPMTAPSQPGFYRLRLTRGGSQQVVDSAVLAVLKPMAEKRGSSINGYRMGFYRGERRGAAGLPRGFLEVQAADTALAVSQHLSLGDFVTHDGQTSWPRYVALDPRLLDKLELVFEEIANWRGQANAAGVRVAVTSGFRTPLHNRRVPRAAGDSRHQYGDAADIAIDADGDGRVSARDVSLIARAVEAVERAHPEMAGGLGLYTRLAVPYAHVDARGARARWRG